MTLLVSSDSGQKFGATPNKMGQNRVTIIYDGQAGAGNNIAYLDARTLYRNGNNMGVMFTYEGAGSVVIAGTGRPITEQETKTQLAAFPWSPIATLNASDRDANDAPNLRQALQFTFTGAGRIHCSRA